MYNQDKSVNLEEEDDDDDVTWMKVLNQCELKRFETFEHFLIKDIYKKNGLSNKIWWT